MEDSTTGMAIKVGLFAALAIFLAGAMIVRFGTLSRTARSTYEIFVEFNDAGNLVIGAPVSALSVTIGSVADVELEYDKVIVRLKVFENVTLYEGSEFAIRQSGLLGDQYVAVNPAPNKGQDKIEEGSRVTGISPPNLEATVMQATDLLIQLQSVGEEVQQALDKVNVGLLSEQNLNEISGTLSNLNAFAASSAHAAEEAEGFMKEVRSKIGSTMGSIDQAFDEGTELLIDSRGVISELNVQIENRGMELSRVLESMDRSVNSLSELLDKINAGEGSIGRLVTEDKLIQELEQLVENWRRYGILYKESIKNSPPTSSSARRVFGKSP
jgi:phospholipid/cholesterol/gamma-HCH transport system substrate-binding protein